MLLKAGSFVTTLYVLISTQDILITCVHFNVYVMVRSVCFNVLFVSIYSCFIDKTHFALKSNA